MLNDKDKQLIHELGLEHLPEDRQKTNLAQYYDTLNIRTSITLEDRLSDKQLEEFEKLHDAGDDEAVKSWLRQTIPDYDQVIADEEANLKQDIRRTTDVIRSAIDKTA